MNTYKSYAYGYMKPWRLTVRESKEKEGILLIGFSITACAT
jgi:hypothetical protein